MKRLKLNLQSLNAEVLTRSQLKQILGGDDGSTPGDGGLYKCCPAGQPNSSSCSTCIILEKGYSGTCAQGVVTGC